MSEARVIRNVNDAAEMERQTVNNWPPLSLSLSLSPRSIPRLLPLMVYEFSVLPRFSLR